MLLTNYTVPHNFWEVNLISEITTSAAANLCILSITINQETDLEQLPTLFAEFRSLHTSSILIGNMPNLFFIYLWSENFKGNRTCVFRCM